MNISEFLTVIIQSSSDGAVPAKALLFQYVNLAIFLGIIIWAVKDKIPAYLRQRRETLGKDIDDAKSLHQESEQRYQEAKQKIDRLDHELKKIRQEIDQDSRKECFEIVKKAEQAAQRIKEEAKIVIDVELERARQTLKQEAAHIAVKQAHEILSKKLDARYQDRLLDDFLKTVNERRH